MIPRLHWTEFSICDLNDLLFDLSVFIKYLHGAKRSASGEIGRKLGTKYFASGKPSPLCQRNHDLDISCWRAVLCRNEHHTAVKILREILRLDEDQGGFGEGGSTWDGLGKVISVKHKEGHFSNGEISTVYIIWWKGMDFEARISI